MAQFVRALVDWLTPDESDTLCEFYDRAEATLATIESSRVYTLAQIGTLETQLEEAKRTAFEHKRTVTTRTGKRCIRLRESDKIEIDRLRAAIAEALQYQRSLIEGEQAVHVCQRAPTTIAMSAALVSLGHPAGRLTDLADKTANELGTMLAQSNDLAQRTGAMRTAVRAFVDQRATATASEADESRSTARLTARAASGTIDGDDDDDERYIRELYGDDVFNEGDGGDDIV